MLIPLRKHDKILGAKAIEKLSTLTTLQDEGREILNKLYLHAEDVVQKQLINYIFQIKKWKLEIPEVYEDPNPPRYA